MTDVRDGKRDEAGMLIRSSGLTLTSDELDRVSKLYAHYTADRAALASHAVGELEPATDLSRTATG